MKTAGHSQGFSLVEVLVALVIVSIGLLGLAKMESLALSSADTAGTRSIAAIQASSLASMMHANHDYWGSANVTALTTVQLSGGATTISDTTLQLPSSTTCTSATVACSPLTMAQYDLATWAAQVQALLPGYLATITCTPASLTTAPPSPVTCTININWAEGTVAANSAQTAIANLTRPSYTLNVEP
jgi:type IV pilus assembly protein PilV